MYVILQGMTKNEAKTTQAQPAGGKTKYDHKTIELKWQAKWQQEKTYQPRLDSANSSTGSGLKQKSGSVKPNQRDSGQARMTKAN